MLKVLLPFASTFIYIYVNTFLHTFLFRLIFHLQGFSSFAEWSVGDMKQSTCTLPATFLHKTIQPPLHILLLILLFNLQCLLFFLSSLMFFFYLLCLLFMHQNKSSPFTLGNKPDSDSESQLFKAVRRKLFLCVFAILLEYLNKSSTVTLLIKCIFHPWQLFKRDVPLLLIEISR